MTATVPAKAKTEGDMWCLWNADCVEVLSSLPSESIHFSVFSPPYSELYVYSNSERDIGNCADDQEFFEHFGFVVDQLFRLTKPGRIVAVDCMNLPSMKERHGFIGLRDFRGDLIRRFQRSGFYFHSEHCIWKDPLIEATRSKALGLMHKQLLKDSSMSRAGIPQYLIAFRRPGRNEEPIGHPDGVDEFIGEDPPRDGILSHERWRRMASPVWMDIRSSRTLNGRQAGEEEDEKHICPMALDIIERSLWLWSNPGDIVLSPFAGIGSEGWCSVRMGRRFIGVELKGSYYLQAVKNLKSAEQDCLAKKLF